MKKVSLAELLPKTKLLKDYPRSTGTEGIKNFFVIKEDDLTTVSMKITGESMLYTSMICVRVRVQLKKDVVASLEKLYNETYQQKLKEANAIHIKHDDKRVSFVIHSGIKADNESILTTEVDDVVKALLDDTMAILNTVFNMRLKSKTFKPVLREMIAVTIPLGHEEIMGEEEKPAKKKAEVKKIDAKVLPLNKKDGK